MLEHPPGVGTYRLHMDGDWGLFELSQFRRQYVQLYSFLYVLTYAPDPAQESPSPHDYTVSYAFRAFPWRGGWSAVDFFGSLSRIVPTEHRPRIVAIQYSSPGFVDLALLLGAAFTLRKIVDHGCSIADRLHSTYTTFYEGAKQRKLLK